MADYLQLGRTEFRTPVMQLEGVAVLFNHATISLTMYSILGFSPQSLHTGKPSVPFRILELADSVCVCRRESQPYSEVTEGRFLCWSPGHGAEVCLQPYRVQLHTVPLLWAQVPMRFSPSCLCDPQGWFPSGAVICLTHGQWALGPILCTHPVLSRLFGPHASLHSQMKLITLISYRQTCIH